jgi:transposase-like protein
MGVKRRQHSKEQKEKIVRRTLSGKSIMELGK